MIGWVADISEFFMVFGSLGLFILSFAEASFFPVPPDILLIGLSVYEPKMALWYSLVATVASVMGGGFGYFIGARAGRPLLQRWVSQKRMQKIEDLFGRYGGWAVAIAGFTPIPYKIFTIASGAFRIDKTVFVIASAFSRGARFFLEGTLLFLLGGARARQFISNYFELLTVGVTLAVIIIYILFRHTKTVVHFGRLWERSRERIRELCARWITPLGDFGTYLVIGGVLCIGFLLIFAKLAEDLIENELRAFDQTVTHAINLLKNPLVTEVMKAFTTMGSMTVLVSLALAVWLYFAAARKRFGEAAMVPIVLAGAALMNDVLKTAFHRSRPEIERIIEVTGYSFPSGHAMISLAFYGMLGYLIWTDLKSPVARYLVVSLLSILVFAIGLSRIYLGVHYPSDVVAGFAAGGCWLTGCILALQALRYYRLNRR